MREKTHKNGSGWNKNIDFHKIDENKCLACVDGYRMSLGAAALAALPPAMNERNK